jgi:crotonobetaine/carnitine-CoA ligase
MSKSVGDFIKEKGSKNYWNPFLRYEGRQVTYLELDTVTNQTANGFLQLDMARGDKACLMLPNCLEFIYAWLGLAKIGAVETPINLAHKGDLLAYLINDSDARVMVLDARCLETVRRIEDELETLETLVVWEEEPAPAPAVSFKRLRTVPFETLYSGKERLDDTGVTGLDDFCIQYTSGTTGPSKGVVMSHNYALHTGASNAAQLGYNRDDVLYTCLPLFHGNAQLMSVLSAMAADARVELVRRFSAGSFWHDIAACGATATNLPGSVVSILLKQPHCQSEREHKLKVVFTAGTPQKAWEEFEERFGAKIYEGYGSTECGMILMNTVVERKVGSIGKPAVGYRVAIFDDEDNELLPGEKGEIVTRPEEPFCMMNGYYKMPDKTLEACRNLWFHTGDYGMRDEEGFYYFIDRKKDVIRRRGENISSFEVERSVNAHPKVLESAALAVPDPMGEYELKVVVVCRPGEELSPAELISFCEERMAYFMVPRYVEFRDSLPKTPTDRVEKYKLRLEGITGNTWDRLKNQ